MTEAATTEKKKRTRAPVNENDPVVQVQRAGGALRRLELAQRRSFERWADAWKQRRATLLAELGEEAFRMLRAGNVCTAKDEQTRNEAIKERALQEDQGGEALDASELIDVDGE